LPFSSSFSPCFPHSTRTDLALLTLLQLDLDDDEAEAIIDVMTEAVRLYPAFLLFERCSFPSFSTGRRLGINPSPFHLHLAFSRLSSTLARLLPLPPPSFPPFRTSLPFSFPLAPRRSSSPSSSRCKMIAAVSFPIRSDSQLGGRRKRGERELLFRFFRRLPCSFNSL
jgi:hypothetical protein